MITLLLLVHATYMYSAVLHTHPIRGESHIQRNTTREVATVRMTLPIKSFDRFPEKSIKAIFKHKEFYFVSFSQIGFAFSS